MSTITSFTPGHKLTRTTNAITLEEKFELRDYTTKEEFTIIESFTAAVTDIDESLANAMKLHGLKQKVGDAGAMTKAEDPTPMKKFNRCKAEYTRLVEEKSWKKKSSSTKTPKIGIDAAIMGLIAGGVVSATIAMALGTTVEHVDSLRK